MSEDRQPDFTRPIRRPSERLSLVEFVASTPTLQESESLEWKSGYDLSHRPDAGKLAKQLIGFANRDPARSQRQFEGYAYVLLGVEAGAVQGVAVWDSADIESWLSRFVPPNLVYDVHYVRAGDRDVLMFEIDPPKPGDTMFCLQASTGDGESTLPEGAIYVRRVGKTEVANASDVARLVERASRGANASELALEVVVASQNLSVLESKALETAVRDSWIERERRRLMKPVPNNGLVAAASGERRSIAEFGRQTEDYLLQIISDWPNYALSRHVLRNDPLLTLAVDNSTDENFENVVVELSIPLPIEKVGTSSTGVAEAVTNVQPIVEWGQHHLAKLDQRIFSSSLVTDISAANDGTTLVRFPPMHVYPQTRHPLEGLILALSPELADSLMAIEWRATASNTRGAITGGLSVSIPGDAESSVSASTDA